ncbi:MAG: hypothetical protein IJK51_04740 [Bacteroidaceae bacterium]|nr:hypothetical protein [Bacteroidaceae bacterium]
MTLYIFNPENDMALADGHPGYTPPAQIQQMRRELWWLPQWWAEEDDIVWNGEDRLTLKDDTRILPWGWSPALCHQLKQAGVQESLLPSSEKLEHIRQLSHRQTAVSLLQELRDELPLDGHIAGESTLCHNIEEAEDAVGRYGEAVMKSPWSSSGRGIRKVPGPIGPSPSLSLVRRGADSQRDIEGTDVTTPLPTRERLGEGLKTWAKRILKAQGSIVVERFLHKVTDFALEFWLDGKGGVEYRGLSLFYTNERGAYLGNWVAPEEQKLAWLAQYIPLQYLQDIRKWWEERLSRFDYAGPVGIDMMLAEEGICPCIEVNWRWTMGLVSCLVAEQGRYGRMVVEYIYGHYSAEVEAFGN